MEIILYLSVALIAIALFILVMSLTKTLKAMKETLESVANTLDGLENQMKGITGETTMLLHKTNALAEDIQGKVEKLDTVVVAVKDVGTTVSTLNDSLKNVAHSVSATINQNQEKIAQVAQWSLVAKEIKEKWFGGKKEKEKKHKPETEVVVHTQQLSRGR